MTKTIFKTSAIVLMIATVTLTSCEAVKKCSSNDNKTKSCSPSCSSNPNSKNTTMENQNSACPKCGKTSCDKSCSANEQSVNGISADLCTTKNKSQIEAEADAFKKMDVFKKISSVKELETGYEFVYDKPDEKLKIELADFLKLEMKCCPTYDYAIVVDAKTNTVHYQRFGSEKIKSELKEYLQMIGLLKS